MKCDNKNPFLVYVNCMTYNHAPYIKDALDGFTIQQTTFLLFVSLLMTTVKMVQVRLSDSQIKYCGRN